jgi:glycosyltransferase involved in cell wall biosynthesis
MKVLYDHQVFYQQRFGGISRIFFELIKAFQENEDISVTTSILFSKNYYLNSSGIIPSRPFLKSNKIEKSNFEYILNQLNSIYQIRKGDFDIFHPTNYNPYFLNKLGNKPFVLTVLDMIHEKYPHFFPKTDTVAIRKKILAEKATRIISISENTKKDLIELLNIDSNKIDVIHLGNSMTLNRGLIELEIEQNNYILFVGYRDNYKNFTLFIEAISGLLHEKTDLSVICIGGGAFNDSEFNIFSKNKIQNKVSQINLSDDELAIYYNRALMFVFPSLYEGFGIPILEAFACNCPVVCSNSSSLPEVAGDAALYFDPVKKDSIQDAVSKLIDNEEIKSELIQRGRERLNHFSWIKTAQMTKNVYENILGEN